jgi:hypothetical protein
MKRRLKMKLIDKDLNEEQVSIRMHQSDKLKREVDEWNIEIERGLKLLEFKVPERQIRDQINELRDRISTHEKNLKVLERQIREKKEKVFEDEQTK